MKQKMEFGSGERYCFIFLHAFLKKKTHFSITSITRFWMIIVIAKYYSCIYSHTLVCHTYNMLFMIPWKWYVFVCILNRELYGSLKDVLVPNMYIDKTTRKVITMQWMEVRFFYAFYLSYNSFAFPCYSKHV